MGRHKKFEVPTKVLGIRIPESKYSTMSKQIKEFVDREGKHPILMPKKVSINNLGDNKLQYNIEWENTIYCSKIFQIPKEGDSFVFESDNKRGKEK